MTDEYVAVTAADGQVVRFAVAGYDGPVPAGRLRDGVTDRAAQTLESGLKVVKTIAAAVTQEVGSLADPPDRVSAEVGLAVTSSATFVVAESSAQAHIVIRLDWERRGG
jgi:Trypsin-co-occurring domain 1